MLSPQHLTEKVMWGMGLLLMLIFTVVLYLYDNGLTSLYENPVFSCKVVNEWFLFKVQTTQIETLHPQLVLLVYPRQQYHTDSNTVVVTSNDTLATLDNAAQSGINSNKSLCVNLVTKMGVSLCIPPSHCFNMIQLLSHMLPFLHCSLHC